MLLFTDWFPPAYQAGGPIRSVVHVASALSRHTEVRVVTSCYDLHDPVPLAEVSANRWVAWGQRTEVCYLDKAHTTYRVLRGILSEQSGQVVYLNSMFSLPFALYPLWYHRFGGSRCRFYLAPRGMLKPSALQQKALKKRLFLFIFRVLGLHRGVHFHATTEEEAVDIRRVFGVQTPVTVLPNLPAVHLLDRAFRLDKKPKQLRLCWVGRIHPIKNLHVALASIGHFPAGTVVLDVIGPPERADYLEQCRRMVPSGVEVRFLGGLPPDATHAVLESADFFILPTQGENFGHAIFEALALGKPVIISDQTPWRHLAAQRAGWDISLQDTVRLRAALTAAWEMSPAEYALWAQGARSVAQAYADTLDGGRAYYHLFFGEEPA